MPDEPLTPGGKFFFAYQILEATDASEYLALSDNNKEAYRLIISCGRIMLNDDSSLKTKLLTMFPSGTATHSSLESLIDG
jgi:hypothetical protein